MGSRSSYPKNLPLVQDKYGRQKPPIEVISDHVSKLYELLSEFARRFDILDGQVNKKKPALEVKPPVMVKVKDVKEVNKVKKVKGVK